MYQPVIIIGAARSGTNMLRDVLTRLPRVGTWPCDEINYIWRHGNTRFATDEFAPAQATPRVRAYIRRQFDRMARTEPLDWIVEKTCANSLRVAFVDRVVPEAKFVFLARDGRDVVASAIGRWRAAFDLPYIAKKARYVPPTDLPHYAVRYLWNRLHRMLSNEKRLASWGPRFDGMQQILKQHSLAEVCAAQWVRSVETSRQQLQQIDAGRVHSLTYEQFVSQPVDETQRLLDFLGIEADAGTIQSCVSNVSARSVGNWHRSLDPSTLDRITGLMQSTLERFGYLPASDDTKQARPDDERRVAA